MHALPEGFVVVEGKWYRVLHPRPVYVVAAGSRGGRANFMAASWVMPFSEDPPRIVASLEKDSYTVELIRETGVFTVNVYSIRELDFVYGAGTTSGREVDKAALLGAELAFDTETGAPRLRKPEPLGFIEARLHRLLDDLAEDVYLAVADVVKAYAKPGFYNMRYGWELAKAQILMHAAGRAFTTATIVRTPSRKGRA